jgi:hypothetical protein
MSLKKKLFKGILISSTCLLGLVAPLTLPLFVVLAGCFKNKAYLTIPFLILDIKSIIKFIIDI